MMNNQVDTIEKIVDKAVSLATLKNITLASYIFLILCMPIVSIILLVVYWQKSKGSVYHSHLLNMKTMIVAWIVVSIISAVIAFTFVLIPVSFVLMGILFLWSVYRCVKGVIRLMDEQPI